MYIKLLKEVKGIALPGQFISVDDKTSAEWITKGIAEKATIEKHRDTVAAMTAAHPWLQQPAKLEPDVQEFIKK